MATYLCCLSALPPQPSPNRQLTNKDDLPALASELVSEISPNLDLPDLTQIVSDALQQLNDIENVYGDDEFFWKYYTTAVAIGFFGNEGQSPDAEDRVLAEARISGGRGAQKRLVDDFNSELICRWETLLLEGGEKRHVLTPVSPHYNHPNFFILEGCYRYLEAWIDLGSAPPRYENFAYDQCEDMELHEELWDIINSFDAEKGRSRTDGRLGFVDYSPAGDIFVHDEWFNYYQGSRLAGSPNLTKALGQGLRGQELMRAIMLDFNCWSTMRPDSWPQPSETPNAQPSSFSSNSLSATSRSMHFFWTDMPTAVLDHICSYLPLSTLLCLSATCWSLHVSLHEFGVLNRVMRRRVPQWLLPVAGLAGEKERAYQVAKEWLPQGCDMNDPFSHEKFPWFSFILQCQRSMSMMNRHRMWVQVKQFEKIWRSYRKGGGLGERKGKTLAQIKQLF